ncbi:transcriptional regulator [Corynebacterium striatum]|uniref:transcriptional regulator n=1 Tax=Corynebacterium striatum TaxID=43770 RepID=UPI00254C9353|nr:transcriptional regulator [Corynebacterium striatum]MDK8843498.1 transcriptional regulator [Corynebacterium striatum]
MREPLSALNPIIQPLNRFKICAALRAFGAVEGQQRKEMRFGALRDETGLTDAMLSKQLKVLEEAGFVTRFREYGSTRAKDTVWVMLTAEGKNVFDSHLAALREIAGDVVT